MNKSSKTHTSDNALELDSLDRSEKLHKAREILGELANEYSDDELWKIVTEIQFLTDCWLDEFEREIFDGKTLNELLKEEVEF